MLTNDMTSSTKQMKFNTSISKSQSRSRDPDTFRLMWHNREVNIHIVIYIYITF